MATQYSTMKAHNADRTPKREYMLGTLLNEALADLSCPRLHEQTESTLQIIPHMQVEIPSPV
jgi:hypothetical protein